MDNDIILLNTDDMRPPSPGNTLWGNRLAAYAQYDAPGVPLCTIVIIGFNRLHKTKYCVECVLKYTAEINYELILVDNGSNDGTLEFFKSVPYENKRIIKVSKNIGGGFPAATVRQIYKGKYMVNVPNDVYVTAHWLTNMLACVESDSRIGYVEPLSNNVSNLQQHDLGGWKDFEEMQAKAAAFNVSDPAKWEERMRLITILGYCLTRRDVFDIVGIGDAAFVHDFGEDDVAARIRRMGYKLVLCKDTWVCHDHDFRRLEDKNAADFKSSLASGSAFYREKYYGIDPWADINNYEGALLSPLDTWNMPEHAINALCVDVRCGTPVLEIRNRLRRRGRTDVNSHAFTTQAKYFLDLHTTGAAVVCDRIDYIQSKYADNTFDVIIMGEPINLYPTPINLLQSLFGFLRQGGILLFKLRNVDTYEAFLRSAGFNFTCDADIPSAVSPGDVIECIKLFGGRNIDVKAEHKNIRESDREAILELVKKVNPDATRNDLTSRLLVDNYLMSVVK